MSARHSPITRRIQARFERWELRHLRELAARQAEQIERLQHELQMAEHSVDFWREAHHSLAAHLDSDTADTRCIGLTRQGELLVVRQGGAA